ncbi:hypothetical protein D3C87_1277640 [compost metagenome]
MVSLVIEILVSFIILATSFPISPSGFARFFANILSSCSVIFLSFFEHKFSITTFRSFAAFLNRESYAARLERKSFFALTKVLLIIKSSCKKDWERKAEIAAQLFKFSIQTKSSYHHLQGVCRWYTENCKPC